MLSSPSRLEGRRPLILRLGEQEGITARCLEFLVLMIVRAGEAIGSIRPEFNLEAAQWTVDGEYEGRRNASLYLVPRAVGIVCEQLKRASSCAFLSAVLMETSLSNMGI